MGRPTKRESAAKAFSKGKGRKNRGGRPRANRSPEKGETIKAQALEGADVIYLLTPAQEQFKARTDAMMHAVAFGNFAHLDMSKWLSHVLKNLGGYGETDIASFTGKPAPVTAIETAQSTPTTTIPAPTSQDVVNAQPMAAPVGANA